MKKTLVLILFLLTCLCSNSSPSSNSMRKARKYYNQAVKEHNEGLDSIAYFSTLNCLEILETNNEISTSFYAECLYNAGIFSLLGLNNIDNFEFYINQAINLYYKISGESEDYYLSIETYADGLVRHAMQLDYPSNIKYAEKAVEEYRRLPNYSENETYFMIQHDLAVLYHDLAIDEDEKESYKKAFDYTIKSLDILDNLKMNDTDMYAVYLRDAGILALKGYNDKDLFTLYLNQSLDLMKYLSDASEEYYKSLRGFANGLVYCADSIGYPQNIQLFEDAIDLYESLPEYKTLDEYRRSLNNLAYYYQDVDIYKSISLIEKVIEIERDVVDEDTLVAMSNLAHFYIDIDNEKALEYASTVLTARLQQNPKDPNSIRIAHHRLAQIYGHSGDFKNAISHSEEARKMAEDIFGSNSEEYASQVLNTGVYLLWQGDTIESIKYIKNAYINPYSDRHLCAYNLAGIYYDLNEFDSCYTYTKESWDLFCRDYLYNLKNLYLENRFGYSSNLRTYHFITSPIKLFLNSNRLDEHMEFKDLAYNCILFNKNIILDCMEDDVSIDKLLDYNTDSIRSYLDDGEVAIEFWVDKEKYLELDGELIISILRNSFKYPAMIRIPCDSLYNALQDETNLKDFKLYDILWKDIIKKAELKEGERVYLSLDEFLNNIPIEYTLNHQNEYVGDIYEIVRVSSTNKIPLVKPEIKGKTAVLYGGLVYEDTASLKNEEKYRYTNYIAKNMFREIGDSIRTLLRSSTEYLPWSRVECDSINLLLMESDYSDVVVYQDIEGTEESFKQLSGNSPSVIHIATHGFSFEPDSVTDIFEYYNYCMDHSGIMMSGVLSNEIENHMAHVKEDGFLRSSEISTLDLTNTELLVLSACKTGKVGLSYLGLSGLQKAFKSAGVKTMLLTLDEVDDAATYLLMVNFYKNLLKGYSKRESLRKAQHELRKTEMFNDYRYWSKFVLID